MALEAQNNPFTSVLMVGAADPEAIADTDPSAGSFRLVIDDTGVLHVVDDAGDATPVAGGFSGDAGDVPFTPVGTIAATDVQAAIAEVAAEAGSLTTSTAALTTGDVTLTQNTYTDVLSLSLAAGTWLILAQANLFSTSGAQDVSARIFNSTDTVVYSNGSMSMAATGYDETIQLHALITIAGTKTIKLQATGSGAGGAKALEATQTNAGGDVATKITAVKVA